ncbi:MAG: 50S ribosomal protein L31 [Elusimicrobia bacterium]|nr:50S ribosomal protein L31 [Elusimicrobiota bacterium]
MKTDIHPRYNLCEVVCICGNSFQTRSTRPAIKVDICSVCHPFYTGKQKLLDTAGRVEKFNKKFSATGGKMVTRKPKASVKTLVAPKHKKKVLSSAPRAKTAKAAKAEAKAEKKAETK